ncbi:MAG: adenylate/guanylate cyclase domain-containing protein [Ardenticatenaceae bacterium]|nr:adenylate/guanylate cyclase domain-containing protein [Ardenticatenaceae bacterium]
MRVGITIGLVVVGEVGSGLWPEYRAMGDAVNVAARMEQTATPGTVRIVGNTYKSVVLLFEVESLGGIDVKGKSEPVLAYRVIRQRAHAEAGALGSRRTSWPILFALSELEIRRGNLAEAETLRRQAREVVEYIADHAGTLELRAAFLNLPPVRAVREGNA